MRQYLIAYLITVVAFMLMAATFPIVNRQLVRWGILHKESEVD